MKTKRKLNIKLLRKIQAHIKEEPNRFFMGDFYAKGIPGAKKWTETPGWFLPSDIPPVIPPCGTAACIAGTANLLTGGKKLASISRAHRELGLPGLCNGYDHPLFYVDQWPEPFASRYVKAKTPRARVKIACERIDHLIQTGE